MAAAQAVELAWSRLDEEAGDEAWARLQASLPCIRVELSPREAVRLHRGVAFGAFLDGRFDDVRAAFAAVLALEPAWSLPSFIPEGHPLRELHAEAVALDEGVLPDPAPARWSVDGHRDARLPLGRAFLVQEIAADGKVLQTAWLTDPAQVSWMQPFAPEVPSQAPAEPTGLRVLLSARGAVAGLGQRGEAGDVHPALADTLPAGGLRLGLDLPLGPLGAWADVRGALPIGAEPDLGLLAGLSMPLGPARAGPGVALHTARLHRLDEPYPREYLLAAPALRAALEAGGLQADAVLAWAPALHLAELRAGTAPGSRALAPWVGGAFGLHGARFVHPDGPALDTFGWTLAIEAGLRITTFRTVEPERTP